MLSSLASTAAGDHNTDEHMLVSSSSSSVVARENAYRLVTCTAVIFSLVSICAILITLPLASQYVAGVQNRVQLEMDMCRVYTYVLFFNKKNY
jgi:hypothetical protein